MVFIYLTMIFVDSTIVFIHLTMRFTLTMLVTMCYSKVICYIKSNNSPQVTRFFTRIHLAITSTTTVMTHPYGLGLPFHPANEQQVGRESSSSELSDIASRTVAHMDEDVEMESPAASVSTPPTFNAAQS